MASQKILVRGGVVVKFQFLQNSDEIPLGAKILRPLGIGTLCN